MKEGDRVVSNHRMTEYAGWPSGERAVIVETHGLAPRVQRDGKWVPRWVVVRFEGRNYTTTVPGHALDPETVLDRLASEL